MQNNFDCVDHVINATQLALYVLQPIRERFNSPVVVSSWYRNGKLNKAVNGAVGSQHTKGEAADIKSVKGHKLSDVFEYIERHLEFDQLIWEFGNNAEPEWIHVSFKLEGNRKEVLESYKDNEGKTKYKRF